MPKENTLKEVSKLLSKAVKFLNEYIYKNESCPILEGLPPSTKPLKPNSPARFGIQKGIWNENNQWEPNKTESVKNNLSRGDIVLAKIRDNEFSILRVLDVRDSIFVADGKEIEISNAYRRFHTPDTASSYYYKNVKSWLNRANVKLKNCV